MRLGGNLELLLSVGTVLTRYAPVLNEVTGVCRVSNLALFCVICNPLSGSGIAFLPLLAFLSRGLLYRAFGEVLGIGVVRDSKVIVIGLCEFLIDGLIEIICKDVIAHHHGVDSIAIDKVAVDLRAQAHLVFGYTARLSELFPLRGLGIPRHEANGALGIYSTGPGKIVGVLFCVLEGQVKALEWHVLGRSRLLCFFVGRIQRLFKVLAILICKIQLFRDFIKGPLEALFRYADICFSEGCLHVPTARVFRAGGNGCAVAGRSGIGSGSTR